MCVCGIVDRVRSLSVISFARSYIHVKLLCINRWVFFSSSYSSDVSCSQYKTKSNQTKTELTQAMHTPVTLCVTYVWTNLYVQKCQNAHHWTKQRVNEWMKNHQTKQILRLELIQSYQYDIYLLTFIYMQHIHLCLLSFFVCVYNFPSNESNNKKIQ